MLEGVFKRFSTQVGGWLGRARGVVAGEAHVSAPNLANTLTISAAARRAARERVPLAMRRTEWEVRELAENQAGRLRFALATPKDINADPHGMTNGINIWVNEVGAKVRGASAEAQVAWQAHHGPLMTELGALQARANVHQLRYNGGRYEPNPWTPAINLPYAEAARKAYQRTPARPTAAEFQALATDAIALAEKFGRAMRG